MSNKYAGDADAACRDIPGEHWPIHMVPTTFWFKYIGVLHIFQLPARGKLKNKSHFVGVFVFVIKPQ